MSQPYAHPQHAFLVVVMGVSGTGKSTLGRAIADSLGVPFLDGDDLHPKANIEKMSRGHPLTDEDRAPWLELIRKTAEHVAAESLYSDDAGDRTGRGGDVDGDHHANGLADDAKVEQKTKKRAGAVLACSALKKAYRDVLRGTSRPNSVPEQFNPPHPEVLPTYFVFIKGERSELLDRMQKRQGHFMKANMLDSQLTTLESPEDEEGTVVVSLLDGTEEQVRQAKEELERLVAGAL